jgi:hypothetical protein
VPVVIDPQAIYSAIEVENMFNLSKHFLSRERASGKLRSVQKGTDFFYRGAWLLSWLGMGSDAPVSAGVDAAPPDGNADVALK